MDLRSIILVVALGLSPVAAHAVMPENQVGNVPVDQDDDREISDIALFAIGVAGLVAGRRTIRKRRG